MKARKPSLLGNIIVIVLLAALCTWGFTFIKRTIDNHMEPIKQTEWTDVKGTLIDYTYYADTGSYEDRDNSSYRCTYEIEYQGSTFEHTYSQKHYPKDIQDFAIDKNNSKNILNNSYEGYISDQQNSINKYAISIFGVMIFIDVFLIDSYLKERKKYLKNNNL